MQVAVLANIPEQQASGETASEDDMGEELQACLAGNEEAESAPAKPVSIPICCKSSHRGHLDMFGVIGTCSLTTVTPEMRQ